MLRGQAGRAGRARRLWLEAFPNLALLRLFAGEGVGADVSTLGELQLARRAEIPGERLVVHGNNKADEELRAAAEAAPAIVALDAPDEVERARPECDASSSA